MSNNSVYAFYGLVALAIFATFLNAIVLISASTDNDTVQNLNWAYGEQGIATSYIGIYNIVTVVDGGGVSSTTSYKYSSCKDSSDTCEDCDNSMKATLAFVVFSLFCTFPSIYANYMRSKDTGNNGSSKNIGLISSVATIIIASIAVIIYSAGCQLKIEDNSGDGVDWAYGPSFGLMITVILLKALDIVVNMLLPVSGGAGEAHPPAALPSAA